MWLVWSFFKSWCCFSCCVDALCLMAHVYSFAFILDLIYFIGVVAEVVEEAAHIPMAPNLSTTARNMRTKAGRAVKPPRTRKMSLRNSVTALRKNSSLLARSNTGLVSGRSVVRSSVVSMMGMSDSSGLRSNNKAMGLREEFADSR